MDVNPIYTKENNKLELLTSLAEKYGTDKLGHGYLPVYSKYLPDKCRTLIEVGVAKGSSALVWNDYFGEDEVSINLVDLFINREFVSERWCLNRNFIPHKGNQADIKFLSSINAQAEVTIDDASHNALETLITFKHLFVNNTQSGGVYFIEDTQCSKDEYYWDKNAIHSFEDTPLWMFKNYVQTGKIQNFLFSEGESEVFESLIKEVHIEADEKIIIIKKK